MKKLTNCVEKLTISKESLQEAVKKNLESIKKEKSHLEIHTFTLTKKIKRRSEEMMATLTKEEEDLLELKHILDNTEHLEKVIRLQKAAKIAMKSGKSLI